MPESGSAGEGGEWDEHENTQIDFCYPVGSFAVSHQLLRRSHKLQPFLGNHADSRGVCGVSCTCLFPAQDFSAD